MFYMRRYLQDGHTKVAFWAGVGRALSAMPAGAIAGGLAGLPFGGIGAIPAALGGAALAGLGAGPGVAAQRAIAARNARNFDLAHNVRFKLPGTEQDLAKAIKSGKTTNINAFKLTADSLPAKVQGTHLDVKGLAAALGIPEKNVMKYLQSRANDFTAGDININIGRAKANQIQGGPGSQYGNVTDYGPGRLGRYWQNTRAKSNVVNWLSKVPGLGGLRTDPYVAPENVLTFMGKGPSRAYTDIMGGVHPNLMPQQRKARTPRGQANTPPPGGQ